MHIVIYGEKADCDICISCLGDVSELQYRLIEYTTVNDYDEFIGIIDNGRCKTDLVLVTANGAEGMEAVTASKGLRPDVAVVWISEDGNFGTQSYRLGCTYFGVKPITQDLLNNAIQKYNKERLG